MPRYVNKPKIIQAIQWNKLGDHPSVTKCTIHIYKLYYPSPIISDDEINNRIESGLLGTIKIGQGDILVESGNYIVNDGKGDLIIYPEELFKEEYKIANAIYSSFDYSPDKQYYSGTSCGNGFSILWRSIGDCEQENTFFGLKGAKIVDVLIACKEYLVNQKGKAYYDIKTKTMINLVCELIDQAINILSKNS